MIEPLARWARTLVVVALVAVIVGIRLYMLRPDSPWCVDSGDASTDIDCPIEVRYDDRTYVVECTTLLEVGTDERVRVQYHDGDRVTDRIASTIRGVSPEQMFVLEDADEYDCPGTELAVNQGLSAAEAVERLAVLSDG